MHYPSIHETARILSEKHLLDQEKYRILHSAFLWRMALCIAGAILVPGFLLGLTIISWNKSSNWWFFGLAFIIIACFYIKSAVNFYLNVNKRFYLYNCGKKIFAPVIAVKLISNMSNDITQQDLLTQANYKICYRYQVAGKDYDGADYVNSFNIPKNVPENLQVYYDEQIPENNLPMVEKYRYYLCLNE